MRVDETGGPGFSSLREGGSGDGAPLSGEPVEFVMTACEAKTRDLIGVELSECWRCRCVVADSRMIVETLETELLSWKL